LRESFCFAISFCIEIYAFGVIFDVGFNPLCPYHWGFEFFPPGAPKVSSERVMLEMLPLAVFLLWCRLPLFSLHQEGWSFYSLMGVQVLSCSYSGKFWVSVHCGRQAS
jgi:hypothetical protein